MRPKSLKKSYGELLIEHEKLVQKFHRRTELGQRMAKVLQSDSTLLVGGAHKKLANDVLVDWDKETKP